MRGISGLTRGERYKSWRDMTIQDAVVTYEPSARKRNGWQGETKILWHAYVNGEHVGCDRGLIRTAEGTRTRLQKRHVEIVAVAAAN